MERYCSTGQSPQWAVVPVEEEEDDVVKYCIKLKKKAPLSIIPFGAKYRPPSRSQ
jgi:hypothetical protein